MNINNVKAGSPFPETIVPKFNGGTLNLGVPNDGFDWKLVVVYRGKHCPMCTDYLNQLNTLLDEFKAHGVEVVAVSADSKERVEHQMKQVNPQFDVGYDLSIEQMQSLGLFISNPRNADESDRPFAEPGLYVVNDEGLIQLIDVSNAPFVRPELKTLLGGIGFVRNPDNNYPIRGTYS